MTPLLARGEPPGWYRGWNGTVHYFLRIAELQGGAVGTSACSADGGPTHIAAPFPTDWGPAKPEKKGRCWPCEQAVRRLLSGLEITRRTG